MNNMEIKTVYIPAKDYIREYRDIPKFLEYCKVCPRYDKCWACPPHETDAAALVAPYEYLYIIGAKVAVDDEIRKGVTGRDAVAAKAEEITKAARKKLDPIILGLEKTMGDSMACYGGTCYLCNACQKIQGKPCIHREKRRSSLESLGFDVAATTEKLLGFELLWSQEQLPPYMTVVSALFTNKLAEGGLL